MKFAAPFLLASVCLAGLAWYLANREPIELPPGMAARHPQSWISAEPSSTLRISMKGR